MKPKRNETAEQTVARWASELLASQRGDFRQAFEVMGWLDAKLKEMRAAKAAAEKERWVLAVLNGGGEASDEELVSFATKYGMPAVEAAAWVARRDDFTGRV